MELLNTTYNPYRDNPRRTVCEANIYESGRERGINEIVKYLKGNSLLAHFSQVGHCPIGSYADDCEACQFLKMIEDMFK